MTIVLVATGSVHESAAACDYLAGRPDVEAVVGVATVPPENPGATRDGEEALNVLRVRLPGLDATTETRGGEATPETLAAADEHGVDEVVVAHARDDLGGLLVESDRPVVVVPAEEF